MAAVVLEDEETGHQEGLGNGEEQGDPVVACRDAQSHEVPDEGEGDGGIQELEGRMACARLTVRCEKLAPCAFVVCVR